ncbi:hypothetical protein CsSME_00027458 [Camellia sinensis var. sinensis]
MLLFVPGATGDSSSWICWRSINFDFNVSFYGGGTEFGMNCYWKVKKLDLVPLPAGLNVMEDDGRNVAWPPA